MKKKSKRLITISLAVLILLSLAYFGISQAIISDDGIRVRYHTESWKGIDLDLESIMFGEQRSVESQTREVTNAREFVEAYNSGDGAGVAYYSLPTRAYIKYAFCNRNNDGDHLIKNDYTIGNSVRLESYMSSRRGETCSGNNYIQMKGTFPKGTLNIDYNAQANSRSDGGSFYIISVGDKYKDQINNRDEYELTTDSGSFNYEINEPEEITITLQTHGSNDGFAEVIADVSFEPISTTTPEEETTEEETEEETTEEETSTPSETETPSSNQVIDISEPTNYLFYLIPLSIGGLVIYIIWRKIKK